MLRLAYDLSFENLYSREGLARLDAAFVAFLGEANAALRERLVSARSDPAALAPLQESDLLVALSPHVDDFVARLFGIEAEVRALAARHNELAPLYSVKRLFVQRRALHKVKPSDATQIDIDALLGAPFTELAFAQRVTEWQQDEAANAAKLELAARYAAWAAGTAEGREKHRHGVLFKTPRKLDYMRLVPLRTDDSQGYARHSLDHLRRREGFALTDPGTDLVGALDEAHYCIWCHEQGKDSCSKGLKEKAPAAGFRKSVFKIPLA